MKLSRVRKGLEKVFYKYGMIIGKHPLPFLLIPIIITSLCSIGFVPFSFRDDSEFLYTPKNGQAKIDRSFFQRVFPEDHENYFSPQRKNTGEGTLNILITKSADGGNVLSEDVIQHAVDIDKAIREITITHSGKQCNYSSLCSKWNHLCTPNIFLELLAYTPESIHTLNLTYPFFEAVFLGSTLADVKVDSNGHVMHAEVIAMHYFIKCGNEEDTKRGNIWLTAVKEYLLEHETDGRTYFYTSITFDEELEKSYIAVIPKFAAAFVILLLFCMLSTMSSDCVYSKPWVALASAVGAFMATITACGFLVACGWEVFTLIGMTPFIAIGKGKGADL